MKRLIRHIIFALFLVMPGCMYLFAQVSFQTIVTKGPVVVGESFQVQYVIEDSDSDNEFFAPDFKDFRFVSGPNIYSGSAFGPKGHRQLKNIVYTLTATGAGKYIVPGASARIENRLIKSNNVLLQVISKTEALNRKKELIGEVKNDDIFLAPGEDPYAKIRRNLFMKVLVDKSTCFVGEPITAIFKLYSRLDSKSDIVKNPGFYGFTVQDMINLADRATSTETINGKDFDVHIVRKVQLYPLQAGLFNIDGMEVRNKVRFSKSAVSKKPEQEIIEGVIPDEEAIPDAGTVVFENSMATPIVPIEVKPTPQKNKPAEYTGATGNFKIIAGVRKEELAKNEEGDLVVTISGNGNFTQLSAPVIQWPEGIEGFEPTVIDSLDHTRSPLAGKREFHFRFVSGKSGIYQLPGVSFSFFNPDTNHYKTIQTNSATVSISGVEKSRQKVRLMNIKDEKSKRNWIGWAGACASMLLLAVLFWGIRKRKAKPSSFSVEPVISRPHVTRLLHPATTFSGADDKTFYSILRNCTWDFFADRFGLKGSQMNKHTLTSLLHQKHIDEKSQAGILELLAKCETGIFTGVEDSMNKTELLEEARQLLENIDGQLLPVSKP